MHGGGRGPPGEGTTKTARRSGDPGGICLIGSATTSSATSGGTIHMTVLQAERAVAAGNTPAQRCYEAALDDVNVE